MSTPKAVMDLKLGRYYSAIFYIDGHRQNWMASLWRDLPDGEWYMTYRFRYYEDERAFESNDRRSIYQARCGADEEFALSALSKAADMLVENGYSPTGEIHKLRPCTDDPMKIGAMLQNEKWAHMKRAPKENADD